MPQTLRIACFQGPGSDQEKTDPVGAVAVAARQAARDGADLMICPEACLTGYAIGADAVRNAAEPLDGPLITRICDLARQTGIGLFVGLPELAGGAIFNTVVFVDKDGTLHASYRKTHLFGDVDRAQFAPGADAPPIFELGGLKIGLLICYDVEFPETVRSLALRGADLIVVPTALMHPAEIVATTVVVSRAFENQVFLAYVNRCDAEMDFDYCGLSCVIGPDGRTLARAGAERELILADIDPAALRAARSENSHLADRRPALYGALTQP